MSSKGRVTLHQSFNLVFSADNVFFFTQVKEICQQGKIISLLPRQNPTRLKKFLDISVTLLIA